ncbi:MAG TPA: ABC transporter permease [Gemmatimonadales bacterium]|nr:ABC transporter permease [Gemmatimonadales bacterium]
MSSLLKDLRYALRSFRKSPGFTLTAILSVALGIGANTAIFSVLHGVLLRPLPFDRPDGLVTVGHNYTQINLRTGVSAVGFRHYQKEGRHFTRSAAFTSWAANLTLDGRPERLLGQRATADYFATLGVQPVLGRGFLPEEEQPGADRVVILSEGLWVRAFGRDRGVLERTLVINGEGHRVVGVVRNGFEFSAEPVAIWKPLAFQPDELTCWGCEWMSMVARLRDGATLGDASTDLERIAAQVRAMPGTYRDSTWGLYARSSREALAGDIRPALLVLMGAVGLVLLIACANLANLLLARATTRQREIAIRTALGAGRWRLARQLLTESLVLALLGGAAGLGLAALASRAFVAANPINLSLIESVGIDPAVLLFTLGLSLLFGLLFGLAPAVQASRPALEGILKEGGRSSRSGRGLRSSLVVSEVALALVLLVGAGLLLRSFMKWTAVDPGFAAEGVLTARLALPPARYDTPEKRVLFAQTLLRNVAAVPGVEAVGGNGALPMSGENWTRSFNVEGYQPPRDQNGPWGDFRIVTPGYFDALRIPIVRGRDFAETDALGAPEVAIVDEVLARKYWPGQDPIGKRVGFGNAENPRWVEIVGVVGHTMQNNPREDQRTQLYVSYAQLPEGQLGLVLRTRGDPITLAPQLRQSVLGIDPEQPIFDVRTMQDRLSASSAEPRFLSLLLGVFALVAATIAAVGIYGVMSYLVVQQTREFGIRLALGADPGHVRGYVLRRGLVLSGLGVAAGLAAALGLGRLVTRVLFDTSPSDPVVLSAVIALLVGVAVLAAWLPARRATRVDPIVALRTE